MTMNRFRRVAELWNWLPAFRAVAEHESVNEAAAVLHISASALSRTVKLLESAVGAELFARRGSGLELTQLGSELLAITRDVMRQVDDCLARDARRRSGHGPLYVGVTSELAAAVVARALATKLDGVVHVVRVESELAADELLHGNLDLVVTDASLQAKGLALNRVGEVRFGVYRKLAQLDDATFVGVRGMPELQGSEITIRCDSLDVAIVLCERASHACVLPDVGWPSLVRVTDARETVTLSVLHRTALPTGFYDTRYATFIERLATVVAR